jgi:RHS repeat-associated protein
MLTSAKSGNIAQIQWQVAGREAQAYTYTYDKLDRMTNAEYTDIHEGSWWSNAYDKNNRYQESLSYDDRGNIMTLNRRGQTQKGFVATNTALMGGNHGTIDNLTYTYNDKNQVTKIIDAATLTEGFKSKNNANTGQYSYDANGNMTSDINKEITNIEYNYLNLPVVISFTNSRKIEFTYDATGKKWRKVVTNGSSVTVRDYIDGAEYESVNNAASEPKIIHHTEGYIEYDATQLNTTWKGWVYHYTLKDHLGNTRVTFSDANDDGYVNTSTDVKQVNNYYPFGLNMEGNWNGAMGAFKYGYNGKELNDELGLDWNDYGARNYDPAIGRFMTVDLLSEHDYETNPYHYVTNNPIIFTDPFGLSKNWFQRAWHWIKTGGKENMDSEGRIYLKPKKSGSSSKSSSSSSSSSSSNSNVFINVHVGRTIYTGPDSKNDNPNLNGSKFSGLYWSQGGHVGIEYNSNVYHYYYANGFDPSHPFKNYPGKLYKTLTNDYLYGGDGDHSYADGDSDDDGISDAYGSDMYFSIPVTSSQYRKLGQVLTYWYRNQNKLPKYGPEIGWRRRCTSMANTILRQADITSWWSRFHTASPHSYFNYLNRKYNAIPKP